MVLCCSTGENKMTEDLDKIKNNPVRKLYLTIPKELYYEIKDRKLFNYIDNIFCKLLTEYLEELDRKE